MFDLELYRGYGVFRMYAVKSENFLVLKNNAVSQHF